MSGIALRSALMTMFEHTSTKVMERPMPSAPDTVVVIARAEQHPSTRRSTGFSRMMPAVKIFHLLGLFCLAAIFTPPP